MRQDLSDELEDKDFKLLADGRNDYLWYGHRFVRSMSPDYSIRVLDRYCRLYKRGMKTIRLTDTGDCLRGGKNENDRMSSL